MHRPRGAMAPTACWPCRPHSNNRLLPPATNPPSLPSTRQPSPPAFGGSGVRTGGPESQFFPPHTTFSGPNAAHEWVRSRLLWSQTKGKVSKTSCAMAANIGEVQGHGDSAAWKAQKSNVLRIFEEFRVSTPQITGLYPSRWDDLTEEVAAACATLC